MNGQNIPYSAEPKAGSWSYAGNDFETHVYISESPTNKTVSVEVEFLSYDQQLLSGKKGKILISTKLNIILMIMAWFIMDS